MKIINTSLLSPSTMPASQTERDWIYNGLDCMVTFEVAEALLPQLDNVSGTTYSLSKDLLGPVLDMNTKGVLIDAEEKDNLLRSYGSDLIKLEINLSRIVKDGLGISSFNWRSNPDLIQLLYQTLGIPPIKIRNSNGLYVPTVNRDALERLQDYLYAQPIVSHILALRDLGKKIGVLRTGIDEDGRIRTSYNIGGTNTGRLSSSFNDFGTGTNLQNIEQRLRRIFIADPGYRFCNVDLEQSDSRALGAIEWEKFGDSRYLDACESGDLHTSVSKLCWPGAGWTGDKRLDREIADRVFYRHHSRRHMAKVLGHGTNFLGGPDEMQRHTKIPKSDIAEFQGVYFAAFPCHLRWHAYTAQTLRDDGYLISLLGRRRWFLGRRTDRETIKQAVAFEPQSITADTINFGMLSVWRSRLVQLLLQVHDSILVQYPEHLENEIVPQLCRLLTITHTLRGGRKFSIPVEAKVGWNWSDADEVIDGKVVRTNPDGLVKYDGSDTRTRTRTPDTSLVDRQLSRVHLQEAIA